MPETSRRSKTRSGASSRRAGSQARKPRVTPPTSKGRTRGFYAIDWIEANCVYTDNEWLGQPAKLLAWEIQYLLELFKLRVDGLRQYRWSYLSVGKKNGKTELCGWLACFFAVGDEEPAARVGLAAAADKQADKLFSVAAYNCENSATLSQLAEVYRGEGRIVFPSLPQTTIERIAANGGLSDGPSWHALLLDELHEWETPRQEKTHGVLIGGTGARRQPITIELTTAGYDLDSLCGRRYQHAKRVLEGKITDPVQHVYIREAGEDADHRKVATWKAANPSYGAVQKGEFYRDMLSKRSESEFRRYYCNQWVSGEVIWIPAAKWDVLADKKTRLDKSLPLFVGIDIALRHDTTAISGLQLAKDGRVNVECWIWENPYPPNHRLHDEWKFDLAIAENKVLELREQFPGSAAEVDGEPRLGPAFGYDPWKFERSAQLLAGQDCNMVEFRQTDARMVPASQSLLQSVLERRLRHNGDPTLRRHMLGVVPKMTPNGERISKPKGSKRKIDGAVSTAIGHHLLLLNPPKPVRRSVYEDHRLMVIDI